MQSNYQQVKHLIRKYSFEFLKVNPKPLEMLEKLYANSPETIEDAKKPNLLAAAIIYLYLKKNGLNGRGGISAKDLEKHFEIKASSISQKVFDVEHRLYSKRKNTIYEYIDDDRYEASELYYEFLESQENGNIQESIIKLKEIIKEDKDFYDPYITLYEYYTVYKEFKKAITILEDGYKRATKLLRAEEGNFPDRLNWGFVENRHIIRVLFNYAIIVWANGDKEQALQILQDLLKSNPVDNIGVRYSIVAILQGFGSQEQYEERFTNSDGMTLDGKAVEEWFYKAAKKHKEVIGWWLELEE